MKTARTKVADTGVGPVWQRLWVFAGHRPICEYRGWESNPVLIAYGAIVGKPSVLDKYPRQESNPNGRS